MALQVQRVEGVLAFSTYHGGTSCIRHKLRYTLLEVNENFDAEVNPRTWQLALSPKSTDQSPQVRIPHTAASETLSSSIVTDGTARHCSDCTHGHAFRLFCLVSDRSWGHAGHLTPKTREDSLVGLVFTIQLQSVSLTTQIRRQYVGLCDCDSGG